MSPFYNVTRTASSIPRKLLAEGKWYWVPVYYLLLTSDLAREGIWYSGSYRFADHIYAGKPKGRFLIGTLLDAILLRLPSASAFRYRYERVKEELINHVTSAAGATTVLSVPSGLAREFFELGKITAVRCADPKRIILRGMDLDAVLVADLTQRATSEKLDMEFRVGDALSAQSYEPANDLIISIGFLDFLPDEEASRFFAIVYDALNPGGRFITSGMQPHRLTDFLMRQFAELHAIYRSKDELERLALDAGFACIESTQDNYKLQTVIVATK